MDFEQIDSITFTAYFEDFDDMAKVATKGISFFNNTFDVLVKEANCEWDTHKVTFILRSHSYSISNVENRMKGTGNSVEWKNREFKILWKKIKKAESYHTANSEQELREQYKDSIACLCNHQDEEFKIDRIISV